MFEFLKIFKKEASDKVIDAKFEPEFSSQETKNLQGAINSDRCYATVLNGGVMFEIVTGATTRKSFVPHRYVELVVFNY